MDRGVLDHGVSHHRLNNDRVKPGTDNVRCRPLVGCGKDEVVELGRMI
jgi:hypothetical protein